MSEVAFKIETPFWPYGLEVTPVHGGLLVRPKKKARVGWSKLFQKRRSSADELTEVAAFKNKFDNDEWQW